MSTVYLKTIELLEYLRESQVEDEDQVPWGRLKEVLSMEDLRKSVFFL